MGPLDKDVVRPDALRVAGDALELELHQHWYRSLPLTSVGVLDIQIDDEPVSTEEITIEANGSTFSFDELAERSDEWWFTTDAITVRIPRADAKPGDEYRVRVDLGLLIPYLLIGPPDERRPLLASSVSDKTLVCH
jgi:uncharacterized protein DUF6379